MIKRNDNVRNVQHGIRQWRRLPLKYQVKESDYYVKIAVYPRVL